MLLSNWLQALVTRQRKRRSVGRHGSHAALRNSLRTRASAVAVESLEDRTLLSTVTFALAANTLVLDADAGENDDVTVSTPAADQLRIQVGNSDEISLAGDAIGNPNFTLSTTTTVNDTLTVNLAGATVNSLSVNPLDGTDRVDVDGVDVSGNISPSLDVRVNGGASTTVALGNTVHLGGGNLQAVASDIRLDADVTTGGTQLYSGPMQLMATHTLTGATVTLGGTVDGAFDLTVDGSAAFHDTVGGTMPLVSLHVTGDADINADVTTMGTQDYDGAMTLPSGTASGLTIIDDGDAGYSKVGTWPRATGQGFNGDVDYHAAGTGANLTRWTFNVAPGNYSVAATWSGNNPNRATNAPYRIYDGATLLGTFSVNQELEPLADFTASGRPFQRLSGAAAIASGTLIVELTDAANEFVIADAVRIEGLGGGDVELTGSTVTFGGTVDGGTALSINGDAVFDGEVGSSLPLDSVTVTGATALNGGAVSTVAAQTFMGPVILGADTTVTADGNLTFGTSIDSDATARALNLTGSLVNVTFTGAVGAGSPLSSFSQVGGTGRTTLNGLTATGATNVATDELVVNSAGADDFLLIRVAGGNRIQARDGGGVLTTDVVTTVNRIVINGDAGDDTLRVDFSGGTPISTSGLEFHGGSQTSGDQLVLDHGTSVTTFGTITHQFVNENDGSVSIDGAMIVYTGLEPISDNLPANDRVFSFLGDTEVITLDAAGAGMSTIDSTLGESVTFANPGDSLTVQATTGTGTDSVSINGLGAGFDADLTVQGGADDSVHVTSDLNLGGGDLLLTGGLINLTADVSTTGSQSFQGPTTVSGTRNFTGSNVAFSTTLNGAADVSIFGNAVLAGEVGTTTPLQSLSVSGTTDIDGGAIETVGTQAYVGAVTLLGTSGISTGKIIDNGDPGYTTPVGTWVTQNGMGFDSDIAYTQTPGGAPETARWTFSGLAAGVYHVAATWETQSNLAPNAPYTIYNGSVGPGNVIGAAIVDQRAGANDFFADGANWESLGGLVTVTDPGGNSGVLIVELDSALLTNYVFADAIRLSAVGSIGQSLTGSSVVFGDTVDGAVELTVNGETIFNGAVGGTAPLDKLNVNLGLGDDFLLPVTSSIAVSNSVTIAADANTSGATLTIAGSVTAPGGTRLIGSNGGDIFGFAPQSTTSFDVQGNSPTFGDPGVPPGDTLDLDFSGLTESPALILGTTAGSGTYAFVAPDTQLPVSFDGIENIDTGGGPFHLVLDMTAAGFEGADTSDDIEVMLDASGTDLLIDVNGVRLFSAVAANVSSLTVLGSADDDRLIIRETAGGLPQFSGSPSASIPGSNGAHLNSAANAFLDDLYSPMTFSVADVGLHFDGRGGANAIEIEFLTDHDAAYFSDTDDAGNSGNLGMAPVGGTPDLILSFANLAPITLTGTGSGGLWVDATGTPNTTQLTLADDGNADDGVSQISGDGGFETTTFSGFDALSVVGGIGDELIDVIGLDGMTTVTDLRLDGSDLSRTDVGDDTLRVRSVPAGVRVQLRGGDGNDTFELFDAGLTVDNILGLIDVDGEGGDDTLMVVDTGDVTGDTVFVDGTGIRGITGAKIAMTPDVSYRGIETLTLDGTSGNDVLDLDFQGNGFDLDQITLRGANGDDTFRVLSSTPNAGNTFLIGDAGADRFIFSDGAVLNGNLDGGADHDTLDFSSVLSPVTVQLTGLGSVDGYRGDQSAAISPVGDGFDNIDSVQGTSSADTLVGPDRDTNWYVTSHNNGEVVDDADGNNLDFTGIENLAGGAGNDWFALSDGVGLSGAIDGGAGNDSLDYSAYTTDIAVDLPNGTATNIGGGLVVGAGGDVGNSIENVYGGSGNDLILGDADANILGDGLGNDTLDGGAADDRFLLQPGLAGGTDGSHDWLTDLAGNDTLDFSQSRAGVRIDMDVLDVAQDLFDGNLLSLNRILPQQPVTNNSPFENVLGSVFNDYILIDPLSLSGNFPLGNPPIVRDVDGNAPPGGPGAPIPPGDTLDFASMGSNVLDTGFSLTAVGIGTVAYRNIETVRPFEDAPSRILSIGEPGFTLQGDWTKQQNLGYPSYVDTVLPSADGSARAVWVFDGISPGTYMISASWKTGSVIGGETVELASNAPFTIKDGGDTISIVAIDLEAGPSDFNEGGKSWQNLGIPVVVTGNRLVIELSNAADGPVRADSIRLERLSAGPEVEIRDGDTIVMDGGVGVDFGSTQIGAPVTKTLTIRNTGTSPLAVSNIVLPTGYTSTFPSGVTSIAAGESTTFNVTMQAAAIADLDGMLSLTTDDVDEGTFNIRVHGIVSDAFIIDNDEAGYSQTAGWSLFGLGGNQNIPDDLASFQSSYRAAVVGGPAQTATYTFTNLVPGTYQIAGTWTQNPNRASDAAYTISGGAAAVMVNANQEVSPDDFEDKGVSWESLSTYTITGTTLTVQLSNASSDVGENFVVADAVRIERVTDPDIRVMVDGNEVFDDSGVVDFGSWITPTQKTFTIVNDGTVDLTLTGPIHLPAGFSLVSTSAFGSDGNPVVLAGGASTSFTVQFDAGTLGTAGGRVWFQTDDPNENTFDFDVTGVGGRLIVDNGDAGYSTPSGTWDVFVGAGHQNDGAGNDAGTGADIARWTFENLTAGRYRVSASWQAAPFDDRATDAPFTIYDGLGGNALQTVRVNQKLVPGDFMEDDSFWKNLGSAVTITGNTLVVELSDDAAGNKVIADAIRIERLDGPELDVSYVDGSAAEHSVSDDVTHVNLGATPVGTPLQQTFTVTNNGGRPLALDQAALAASITKMPGFSLASGFGSALVAPGGTTTFVVQLDAAVAGSFRGEISFAADDLDESQFGFTLSGSAYDVANRTVIDNGDADFAVVGNWLTAGGGGLNSSQLFNETVDAPGDVATWTFTGLAPGLYRVSATWAGQSNLATNAPYHVFNGAALPANEIGAVSINQQAGPNGFVDDLAAWQDLGGPYVVSGGTLTIELRGETANGFVFADGLRVELLTAAPEIEVTDGATLVVDGGSTVDFGTLPVGSSANRVITVTNTGSDVLSLDQTSLSDSLSNIVGFSLVSGFGATSLAPGASTTFEIRLDVTAQTEYQGVVRFCNNDHDENRFSFLIRGNGIGVQIIDNGDAGFATPVGNWVTTPGIGFEGDIAFNEAVGGATETATWTFDGLAAGVYRVSATWKTQSNLATNASYTLYDGSIAPGNVVGSAVINQQTGANDFTANGAVWEDLGGLVVVSDPGGSTGVLIVELDSTSANNFVFADAIRLEMVQAPEIQVSVDGATLLDDGTLDLGVTGLDSPVTTTVTVTNAGTMPLNLGSITAPSGYSIVTFGSTTLAPGASTTFDLILNATAFGTFAGQVSFGTNDPDESPFNFSVSGSVSNSRWIDDGDAGFTTVGTWAPIAAGFNGDLVAHDGLTAPNGDVARWTFTNLVPGALYRVSTTWNAEGNQASNAQFTITGGAAAQSATFNQKWSPTNAANSASSSFVADGTNWANIGHPYLVTGTTLTVELDVVADGRVVADAVRIERISGAEIELSDGGTNVQVGGSADFGNTFVDQVVAKTFTVYNVGATDLTLDNASLVNALLALPGYSLVGAGFADTTVVPGGSTTFDVQLDASAPGAVGGTISFNTNDADENPFTFDVSGNVESVLIIDNGQAGFATPDGTWVFAGGIGFDGGILYNLTPGSGSPLETATWTFSLPGGLPAGMYRVSATWKAQSNLATDAPYTIFDGTNGVGELGSVAVDQKAGPNDFAADGAMWEDLGAPYQINSGTVTVALSDQANNYVFADAIRIEWLGPLQAAGSVDPQLAVSQVLTQEQLQPVVRQAAMELVQAGLASSAQFFDTVQFKIVDLPAGYLGGAGTSTVFIDANAAGFGWNLSETATATRGGVDLLHVVEHELGHLLGLSHHESAERQGDVMASTLSATPLVTSNVFYAGYSFAAAPAVSWTSTSFVTRYELSGDLLRTSASSTANLPIDLRQDDELTGFAEVSTENTANTAEDGTDSDDDRLSVDRVDGENEELAGDETVVSDTKDAAELDAYFASLRQLDANASALLFEGE